MAEHADLDDGKESAGRSRNSTPKTSQPAGGSTVMMQSCVADQLFHDRGLSEEFAGPPLCAHNALITLPFRCSRRIGEPQPASAVVQSSALKGLRQDKLAKESGAKGQYSN